MSVCRAWLSLRVSQFSQILVQKYDAFSLLETQNEETLWATVWSSFAVGKFFFKVSLGFCFLEEKCSFVLSTEFCSILILMKI